MGLGGGVSPENKVDDALKRPSKARRTHDYIELGADHTGALLAPIRLASPAAAIV